MIATLATAAQPAAVDALDGITIRPLEPGDGLEVRLLFRDTLVLGRPLRVPHRDLYAYERLSLDWHLSAGRADSRVVVRDGQIVGYLLVCLHPDGHDRWARVATARWMTSAAWRLSTGRLRGTARTFTLHRLSDTRRFARRRAPRPFPAHAHLNLAPHVRSPQLAQGMAAAVDQIVADAGLAGWYEDIDVPRGRSISAFTEVGAHVVQRTRSETFSWLTGVPVDRLRLARCVTVQQPAPGLQADVHPRAARPQTSHS